MALNGILGRIASSRNLRATSASRRLSGSTLLECSTQIVCRTCTTRQHKNGIELFVQPNEVLPGQEKNPCPAGNSQARGTIRADWFEVAISGPLLSENAFCIRAMTMGSSSPTSAGALAVYQEGQFHRSCDRRDASSKSGSFAGAVSGLRQRTGACSARECFIDGSLGASRLLSPPPRATG